MRSQIWIPSKGRPDNLTTKRLCSENLPHTIWVEPQDYDSYVNAAKVRENGACVSIRQLPLSDQGIAYVRQLMLNEMRNNKHPAFTLEDDIINFYRLSPAELGTPRKKSGITFREVLEECETAFLEHRCAVGSLPHATFAHWNGNSISTSGLDVSSFWFNGEEIPEDINYDGVRFREDTYISGLMWLKGLRGMMYCNVCTHYVPDGVGNKSGGNNLDYAKAQILTEAIAQITALMTKYKTEILQLSCFTDLDRKRLKDVNPMRLRVTRAGHLKGVTDIRPNWNAINKFRACMQRE